MRHLPFISIRLLSAMSDTQPRLHLQALAQLIRRAQSQPFRLSAAPATNPSTRARTQPTVWGETFKNLLWRSVRTVVRWPFSGGLGTPRGMSHESISHDKSGTIHILNVFLFKINPLLHRINSKTFFLVSLSINLSQKCLKWKIKSVTIERKRLKKPRERCLKTKT